MSPRTLKIALAASVALNLFAVAGGGAAWWMWSRVEARVADQQRPPRTQSMKEIVGAMEPEVSERVLRSLRASAMAARPDFEAGRTARREAIEAAKDATRDIDTHLVDAQETRRILDRLYGYEVSPVLWRKVGPGLSAGRVQSAATRLVVDRERERIAFVKADYWGLELTVAPADGEGSAFTLALPNLSRL